MSSALVQYLLSGLTVGSIYALVALGFTIIFNASHVINFAQGEFVMIGGMSAVSLVALGVPLPLAILLAICAGVLVGVILEKIAVDSAQGASVITLIIITIGASILLRGLASLVWDKNLHALQAFSGDQPIAFLGASLTSQSLWVIGVGGLLVLATAWFFNRTITGKAMLATSYNPLAASLVGIDTRRVLTVAFGLSAGLGATAGILTAPITLTSYDVGVLLGLKGFAAAVLGGLGSGVGAVVGGLSIGLIEALSSGYISSAYKDVVAFVVLLLVLFFLPGGLFGRASAERV